VWYPTEAAPKQYTYGGPTSGKVAVDAEPYTEGGPYPLLIFAHGYGGSGLASVFFLEPLAAHGWIVVAPDFNDRHTAVRIRTGQKKRYDRMALVRHAEQIGSSGPEDRDKYMYRLDEMKLALDRMLESELFGKLIDKKKIAVGGHSFGGFTALGLCGTIKERRDDRIKGVLLFSSGAGGYLFTDSELAAVKVRSMYFLGEREKDQKRGTKAMVEIADKVYRNLPPPKYFLEVRGANHFSFTNRFTRKLIARLFSGTDEQFDVIRRYSIAFLEKYVAGKENAGGVLEQQNPLLTRYMREL
jgi:predicted dienelactone hydrolase